MRKRKTAFDVAKWADATKGKGGGRKCSICVHKDAAQAVEIVIQRRKSGKSQVTQRQIVEMLRSQFGVMTCPTSFINHLRYHVGASW